MSWGQTFRTGYLRVSLQHCEEVFLSVTPNFERGPGIQRDGISQPRMTDPHTVQKCVGPDNFPEDPSDLPATTNPYVQRAGTWTLFHHVQNFIERHGKECRIIGIQSCGDLTMNPWHVALIKQGDFPDLCHLATPNDPHEPVHERIYHCLVKWNDNIRPCGYEFIDLRFEDTGAKGWSARIIDKDFLLSERRWLKKKGIKGRNIAPHVEFALAGKPIIEKGRDLELSNAIDRFQDVRHIFDLPVVPAVGAMGPLPISAVNFGEHVLYKQSNARRAALNTPILVDLKISENVEIVKEKLFAALEAKHFRKIETESPVRRSEFREYSPGTIEVFFPHNAYPFGVIGGKSGQLVCLASGGLSGRVGNTLDVQDTGQVLQKASDIPEKL